MNEIVVDNFAGGGGASTGIELAIGRSVDIAINHDPAAIAMHEANHPEMCIGSGKVLAFERYNDQVDGQLQFSM